ncbi:MAG: TonB-dependent receptor [Caulobacteraceae bacterium]
MRIHDPRISVAALLAGASLAVLGVAAPAAAQDAPAPQDTAVGEVVVTASRVARTGFTAPTPTQIVNADTLEKRGATNIAMVLNELPAFKATTTPATNGVRAIFPGSFYADLRGLGAVRTLVLVDGKRFVPQVTTGLSSAQVDLNQIPALMLDRTEVVTGGASAQWGSDAVAGVVNLILKKNFAGFEMNAQVGQSMYADNQEARIGFIAGKSFLDDRAHATFAFDYVRNNGVDDAYSRPWGRQGYGLVTNPCALQAAVSANCPTGGNGLAQNLIIPDVRYSQSTAGGIINNAPGTPVALAGLRGITFGNVGSAPRAFQYGTLVGSQFMQGGDQVNQGQNIYTGIPLGASSRRTNAYSRFSYKLTDDINAYVEGSYAESTGSSRSLPARNEQTNAIPIKLDNPYIPASILQTINAYNVGKAPAQQITGFNLGRVSEDLQRQRSVVSNYTTRFVGGLEGSLPIAGNWKWDAAYVYGMNRYTQHVNHDRILANFNFAADAAVNPATGQIVCRATIPGASFNAAAAGCVPMNVFGNGAGVGAQGYVTGTLYSRTIYDQNAFNFNLTGEPVHTWAGPVSVATGFEWRKESQVTVVDAIAEKAGYESTNARSLSGDFNVKEGYLETVIPLARDMAFAKSFDLNGAVRITDYSTSGTVTTWKVGATYTPFDGFLIRGARSRDIRAPSLFELYTLPVSTILNIGLNQSIGGGPSGNVGVQGLTGGNANLQPEKADTTTIGFSYSPSFVPGLQVSLDWYNINVKGAIASVTAAQVATFCNTGNQYYCGLIVPNGVGAASAYTVNANYQNLNQTKRSGLDILASYRTPLDRFLSGAPGRLTVSFAGNYVLKYGDNVANAGYIERAGETVSTPRFTSALTATYDIGKASVTAQWRHIDGGLYNVTFVEGVNINDNTIDGADYINLSGSYDLTEKLQLFGVVNNLFNKQPPFAPQNFGYPTINTWFDLIGRTYKMGVRYRF